MTYLLDVNALMALGAGSHEFHDRVAVWVHSQLSCVLATCSITELGFVRILAQTPVYGFNLSQARTLLQKMKTSQAVPFIFLADDHDISELPIWVRAPKQVTDGHLSRLANAHSAVLATLDSNIPDSFVIPK